MKLLFTLALPALSVNAYWLMGSSNFITTERMDPVVGNNKMTASGHVHSVFGGSNFRFNTTTASLRQSQCTTVPIPQDKSAYWFPHLYFQWNNGSFTSLDGGAVVYYLFSDKPGMTTAFPDDFRMISGDPFLRTYTPTSAQKAVTFLCLDFNGKSVTYNSLPPTLCPNGVRAQINFPSCWDGKNLDSVDHKSHVAFLSGGPDSGTCSDPKFPVVLPRIFMEVYWNSNAFDGVRSQAMNPIQPFVYAHGDPVGYGYHADFVNGWDKGVLQKAVDNCHCNPYGDPQCCADQKIFDLTRGQQCRITKSLNEQTTGTLLKLPGNNPVQKEGKTAVPFPDTNPPQIISPVYVYTGNTPTATGQIVTRPTNVVAAVSTAPPSISSIPTIPILPKPSSSSSSIGPKVPASAVPTPPHSSIPPKPSSSSSSSGIGHNAPAVPTPSNSDPVICGTPPKSRRSGLDYHRHHRRFSHDDFFNDDY